ncbi:hypothetical protein HO173_001629 [Letharia columbiana]|uniref:C2H2-type domain-containing protein n=1 Tax=Letharia columbiana TaxID=112416 RepID=A0A8H6G3V3_9LECA|nr:uncharacterized protein HO173_001629 [Letharia columbiana]KAF6240021.1 hypothetical protein HO173_001629 [Letharia columbiana]
MAPTQSTCPPVTTRSVTRKNSVALRSLDAGVHKHFQCIVCDKKHGSRAALSRHFKSHTTRPEELSPFTHPSCWDEDSATHPPNKQHIFDMIVDDNVFDALPSKKQRAINTNIEYALAGVKNKRQLRHKADQQRLRLLHWWFRANEKALRARMDFGPAGLFPRQGERKLQDQGQALYVEGITAEDDSLLALAGAPPISQVESLSATEGPITQADQLASNPDQPAPSVSAQTGLFDHDFDRSLEGSVVADFELASTRPLTSLPLLWCMSNTFTHFVKTHGEDLVCVIALKRAAEIYLRGIEASQDVVNKLNSRFDHKIMGKYDGLDDSDDEDKWVALLNNEKRFRKDRAFIWDRLEEATHEYFNDYSNSELPVALGARHSSDAVKVVVKATRAFASVLGDVHTSAYVKNYWIGKI